MSDKQKVSLPVDECIALLRDYDTELTVKQRAAIAYCLEKHVAQLSEYENVIIPSWKREEEGWRQDESDAIEFRRVLAEELDKRDADIARLRAWLRNYQPTSTE